MRFSFFVLALGAALMVGTALLSATPTIGTVSATPTIVKVLSPTVVTVTAAISDPLLLPQSVNLLRLAGATSTLIAVMHDDGIGGDAIAGDHIFTARIIIDESYLNPFQLQVSAAFKGALRRITSTPIQVNVQGLLLSDVVSNTPVVVQGTIASATSYYSGVYIFTDLQLTISNVIKGSSIPSSIVVRTLGGVIGSDSQQPTGSPGFTVGQQLLLFLGGPASDGKYFLESGALGIFRIQENNGQAVAIVDPGYSFMELAEPLDLGYASLLSRSSQLSLSLASLIASVSGH